MANKIEDFGEKIGGARKDKYFKQHGMSYEDFTQLTDEEKNLFFDKKYILPKYDYQALKDEYDLTPQEAMYIKKIYDSVPKCNNGTSLVNEHGWAYVKFCETVRQEVDKFCKLDAESRAKAFETNETWTNIRNNSGLAKEGRYDRSSPEYKSFTHMMASRSMTGPNIYKIMNELERSPYLETPEQFADRMIIGMPIAKDKAHLSLIKMTQKPVAYYDKDYDRLRLYNVSGIGSTLVAHVSMTPEAKYAVLNKHSALNHTELVATEEELPEKVREMKDSLIEDMKGTVSAKQKKSVTNQKKKAFKPIVEESSRSGEEILYGIDITGHDYLDTFNFRGGEFGNWLNDKERQTTLNSGYEAFLDLANALDVKPEDLSLGGKLGIAFGARGVGSAAAHYEPTYNVINLTKMKGMGCLGHEWGHALDFYLAKSQYGEIGSYMEKVGPYDTLGMKELKDAIKISYGQISCPAKPISEMKDKLDNRVTLMYNAGYMNRDVELNKLIETLNKDIDRLHEQKSESLDFKEFGEYLAENKINPVLPITKMLTLIDVDELKQSLSGRDYRKVEGQSNYVKDSINMDKMYSKTGHGYWSSDCEMFARAFACYVSDKLEEKGIISPYLNATAYAFPAVPKGEEKERINKAFDKLIDNIKEAGILHDNQIDYSIKIQQRITEDFPDISESKYGKILEDVISNGNYNADEIKIDEIER